MNTEDRYAQPAEVETQPAQQPAAPTGLEAANALRLKVVATWPQRPADPDRLYKIAARKRAAQEAAPNEKELQGAGEGQVHRPIQKGTVPQGAGQTIRGQKSAVAAGFWQRGS